MAPGRGLAGPGLDKQLLSVRQSFASLIYIATCPTTVLNMFFYFILTDILISFNGIAFHFYTAHFLYCEFGAAPFIRTAQTISVGLHRSLTGRLSYLTRRHHVIYSSLTSKFSRELASWRF